MRLEIITAREASVFACLADTLCAPGSGFPPVSQTTATEFIDRYLDNSPRLNRVALRMMFIVCELGPFAFGYRARMRRLDPEQRAAYLSRFGSSSLPLLRAAFKLIKSMVNTAYYGDDRVLKTCGYDSQANVRRARALRAKEGRP